MGPVPNRSGPKIGPDRDSLYTGLLWNWSRTDPNGSKSWFAGPVLDLFGSVPDQFQMVPCKQLDRFQTVPCKQKLIWFGSGLIQCKHSLSVLGESWPLVFVNCVLFCLEEIFVLVYMKILWYISKGIIQFLFWNILNPIKSYFGNMHFCCPVCPCFCKVPKSPVCQQTRISRGWGDGSITCSWHSDWRQGYHRDFNPPDLIRSLQLWCPTSLDSHQDFYQILLIYILKF